MAECIDCHDFGDDRWAREHVELLPRHRIERDAAPDHPAEDAPKLTGPLDEDESKK